MVLKNSLISLVGQRRKVSPPHRHSPYVDASNITPELLLQIREATSDTEQPLGAKVSLRLGVAQQGEK